MKAVRFVSPLAAVALVACSGGPGTSGTIKVEPREPPGTSGAPESPGKGESPEPTSGGPEAPNGDAGTSSGGGSGNGAGSCPACDESYTCTVGGQSGTATITLATDNGQCVLSGSTAVFSCDGTITVNGGTVSWTPFGNGGFRVTVQNEPETCIPAGAAVPPPGSSTSGS